MGGRTPPRRPNPTSAPAPGPASSASPPRSSRRSGALPEALKNFAFGTFLLFFYNQVLHVDAFKASAAIALALIIDAGVDPLIGSFSDDLKTRLGRRHPLMYLSAVPIAVGLYLAFSPPAGLSEKLLLVWLFGTVVITHVSMSVFVVPWTALYAEFSDDYAERTTIVTWRYAVGWLGTLVFILAHLAISSSPAPPAYKPGQLNPHAYAAVRPGGGARRSWRRSWRRPTSPAARSPTCCSR